MNKRTARSDPRSPSLIHLAEIVWAGRLVDDVIHLAGNRKALLAASNSALELTPDPLENAKRIEVLPLLLSGLGRGIGTSRGGGVLLGRGSQPACVEGVCQWTQLSEVAMELSQSRNGLGRAHLLRSCLRRTEIFR